MPFTPFHMGPAAALKAAAPRHLSLTVFGFSQVLIDLEPLYYMLRHEAIVHRFFHTYVGATLVGLAAVALGRPVCQWLLMLWPRLRGALAGQPPREDARVASRIPVGAAVAGAFLGVYSHVVLDSIMHADIRPLAPFSQANPLFRVLSLGALHQLCLGAGIVGLIVLAVTARRQRA
jgi:hypothetical protein